MFNQVKYANKFNKENYKQFTLRINKKDLEVLEQLEKQSSINSYIINLIKQDIKDEKTISKLSKKLEEKEKNKIV